MNKVLKFGIASVPVQRARTLAIAAGKRQRCEDEPQVWFPSVMAMARVLSDENMALLKVIRESHPDSMDALAKAVGKHAPNVSRSLHTMAQYGLVKLVKHGRTVMPQVTSEGVSVDFSWGS
jgi:predicted transcriptional regulator